MAIIYPDHKALRVTSEAYNFCGILSKNNLYPIVTEYQTNPIQGIFIKQLASTPPSVKILKGDD